MCTNLLFVPIIYFFYPETAKLTLEEVDYLFVRDGHKGVKQLWHRSQPVLISLKGDVGSHVGQMGLADCGENKGDEEKTGDMIREESADHIEAKPR